MQIKNIAPLGVGHDNLQARLAGLGYLIMIVSGIFGMVYVPAVVFDWSDPARTILNIQEREMLFRSGVLGSLISYIAFAGVSILLFRLFSQPAALPALVLLCSGVLGSGIYISNAFHYVEIITLLSHPPTGEPIGQSVLYLAASFNEGFKFIQSTTGIWLISFGIVAYQTSFLPKVLSILLVYSGAVNYIADFLFYFIFEKDLPLLLSLPGTLAEFSTCLWLLIVGATWTRPQGRD